MESDGADIIDVGAESTRPGNQPISAAAEIDRLISTLSAICDAVSIPVSVDTYKAPVVRHAIAAGASMVNDVWGCLADGNMAPTIAAAGVPANPDAQPGRHSIRRPGARRYRRPQPYRSHRPGRWNRPPEHHPRPRHRLSAKPPTTTWNSCAACPELREMGYQLLLGVSRKSTIGRILNLPAEERLEGTAAAVAMSIDGGADIVRVHDVKEMVRVARMTDAIVRDWRPSGWPNRQ